MGTCCCLSYDSSSISIHLGQFQKFIEGPLPTQLGKNVQNYESFLAENCLVNSTMYIINLCPPNEKKMHQNISNATSEIFRHR